MRTIIFQQKYIYPSAVIYLVDLYIISRYKIYVRVMYVYIWYVKSTKIHLRGKVLNLWTKINTSEGYKVYNP